MTYKKNDIVKFVTNQPGVHLMEMFGHCEFKPEEIAPMEYIGRVKSVVADGKAYLVAVISDWGGHICILNPEDIIGQMQESELTEEQRKKYHERGHLDAPNVYDNDPSWLDGSKGVEEKCKAVAKRAMAELFPEKEILDIEMDDGFLLENYIKDLDYCLEHFAEGKTGQRKKELRERRDALESWFRTMRFKEFYGVTVGVECTPTEKDIEIERLSHNAICRCLGKPDLPFEPPKAVGRNWLVAIDLHFEEVSIMRDDRERRHFFMSLGREHRRIYEAKIRFAHNCME